MYRALSAKLIIHPREGPTYLKYATKPTPKVPAVGADICLIELRPPKDRVFAPKVLGTSARRLALPTMETTELQAKHKAE